jgi:hypothetical protein
MVPDAYVNHVPVMNDRVEALKQAEIQRPEPVAAAS